MSISVAMTLLVHGQFLPDSFPEWITRRAAKLSLSGWVRAHSDNLIEIFVSGDQILIEALEVACSLGPIDARVDSIEKQLENKFKPPGRHCSTIR